MYMNDYKYDFFFIFAYVSVDHNHNPFGPFLGGVYLFQ